MAENDYKKSHLNGGSFFWRGAPFGDAVRGLEPTTLPSPYGGTDVTKKGTQVRRSPWVPR